MVRWIDGLVGSGQVLPMVQLYTGFDESEMPKDRLIVLEVEGMTVNANLDARMEGLGYILFKRQGTSMAEVYEWYENEVVHKTARAIRRSYNPFDVSNDNEPSLVVSDVDATRVWIDSDMEQIKRITDLEVAERNLNRGLTFAKIGAKFTGCVQACDRHPAFKIKRRGSRTTTVKDKETPLKLTLENGMQRLRRSGRLIISTRKKDVIVDTAATGPAMQGKAYDEEKNRKSFVSAGFLDEGSQTCPDLDGMEAATNINFERNPHLRTILNQTLVPLMRHAHRKDELPSEEKYTDLEYPLDMDMSGEVWRLKGNSIVFARSMPLYSKLEMERKRAAITAEQRGLQRKQDLLFLDAENVLKINTECERKILGTVQARLGVDESRTVSDALAVATLDDFGKCKAASLAAFVAAREFEDASKKWKVPNKGSVSDVQEGKKCKKTGQTLLLKLAYDKRSAPVAAKIPDRVQIVLPKMNLPPPLIVRFVCNECLADFSATVDWCGMAYLAVKSIESLGSNYLDCHLGDLVGLNNTCRLMARKLLDRLPNYIAAKLPSDRRDLQPGQHWVFSSLCKHLPRICTLMGLQNQIARDLETRGPDEGYLALPCEFQSVIGEFDTMNGAYIFEDTSRGNIIRAGTATAGLKKRFDQHVQASLLTNPKTNKMDLYRRYPHESIANNVPGRKGTFQSLKQLAGAVVDPSKKEEFSALFLWDDIELTELQKLTIKGESNSMADKKCKHLIYLYEIALGIAIEPCMNVSGNPGCEWQLHWFGD